jgi:hypothetical protein
MDLSGAIGHRIGPNQLHQIDDEIVHLRRLDPGPSGTTTLVVLRGQEGTTAVRHLAGTEVVALPAYVSPELGETLDYRYIPSAQHRDVRRRLRP